MRGIDTARYQGNIDFQQVRAAGYQFVIQKCTEAVGYKDPTYEKNKANARANGLLFGSYHFGRGTDAKKEADWFISQVGDIRPGELLVLDYEIYTLADPASWCLEFSKQVEKRVGFKPLLYTYHGILKSYNWKKCSDYNIGLWAARYYTNDGKYHPEYPPTSASWPFVAIHQYTSRGSVPGIVGNVDLNHTEMNIETLRKYGKPGSTEPVCNQSCHKHCK